ncbi:YybH family protein [Microbulbifer rhizosphaerae]|uniref:Ketosteroid isomerase-like protein n=1 Tax=Microbulbifer rhizosphaerae TaxID=1562603 RepID=A0A7W4WFH5_9GAMM|nr:nuclear transport factor 2 family protein [Microbulbifer rhizosphaerae]MBB3063258.1 ketosteroid isomerase-like protein [Microbulbifer rhizosphaerae]
MQKLFKALCASGFSVLLGAIPLAATAHGDKPHGEKDPAMFSGLETGAGKTVQKFHRALREGDEEAVLSVLADTVVIFEGGSVERSAQEYAGHHLPADITFLKQMDVSQQELQVREGEDLAFSYGRSRLKGDSNGKALDLQSMETLVLKRSGGEWKIVHVHWSSK